MFWNIENILGNTIAGWAYDKAYEGPLEVLALNGVRIVARALAGDARAYLAKRGHSRTNCGFVLTLPEEFAIDSIRLVCLPPSLKGECLILFSSEKNEIGNMLPSYQTTFLPMYDGAPIGSSDSEKK